MPTRIVLKETTPPSRLAAVSDDDLMIDRAYNNSSSNGFATPPRPSRTGAQYRGGNTSSHRKVVGFRSSILRDLSNQNYPGYYDGENNNNRDEAGERRRMQLHLSNEDIRASPRLLGYLFGCIGMFYRRSTIVVFIVSFLLLFLF